MTPKESAELRTLAEASDDFTGAGYIDVGLHESADLAFLTIARGAVLELLDATERVRRIMEDWDGDDAWGYRASVDDALNNEGYCPDCGHQRNQHSAPRVCRACAGNKRGKCAALEGKAE